MKLTKTTVEKLPVPDGGQALYRDDELKGFAVRVTPGGVKSFVVEKRIQGKVKRKTLGRFGALTAEQARRQALAFLGKVAIGQNPIAEEQDNKARGVTLSEVFELYLKVHPLASGTEHDYRRHMKETFSDWMDRPLANITKDMVGNRHKQRGAKSPSRANGAMRVLRALFRFAHWQYEDSEGGSLFPENPVDRLSRTRSWYPNVRRRTLIKADQLSGWFEAVESLKTDEADPQAAMVADLLLLCLFTGMRRTEAMTLKWTDVDFVDRALTVMDTKNHEPLRLPLSTFLFDLLQARREAVERAQVAVQGGSNDPQVLLLMSPYVFPGSGKTGHLVEPRPQMDKVSERSGVSFTLHDLRRTFLTVADSLNLSTYTLKHMANHKITGDVTAGYVMKNLEQLRAPMEAISQKLCHLGGVGLKGDRQVSGNVISINPSSHTY